MLVDGVTRDHHDAQQQQQQQQQRLHGKQGEYVAVVNVQGPDKAPAPREQRDVDLTVHTNTAYSIGITACAMYFFNAVLDDLRNDGSVSILRWRVIVYLFLPGVLAKLLGLWLLCNAALVLGNLGVRCWRAGRQDDTRRRSTAAATYWKPLDSTRKLVWDWMWALAAALLHACLLVVPVVLAYWCRLPSSAIGALCAEQLRLLMKSYSYLREHVRSALASPPVAANHSLGHLAYFMFAPTLLYRDSYERTPRVRPLVLLRHAAVFLLAVFTMVVVTARTALRPVCDEDAALMAAWVRLGAPRAFALLLRFLPAALVLSVGSTIALHHWHRAFAELLRFRARRFTRAWWNGSSYEHYFRDWNQLVKDWLNKYVFKEMRALGCSCFMAKIITVAISAFWHEYILSASLGFIVPFFFFFYCLSTALVLLDPFRFQRPPHGNLFLIFTYPIGIAAILLFYFSESFARLHCPVTTDAPWDTFVPRHWSGSCDNPFKNCTFF